MDAPDRHLPRPALLVLSAALACAVLLSAADLLAGLRTQAAAIAEQTPLERRRQQDGWFRRMEPIVAAIREQVPPEAPLLIDARGVPPWFLAAELLGHTLRTDSPARQAELQAAGVAAWHLELRPGEPPVWSLTRLPRDDGATR